MHWTGMRLSQMGRLRADDFRLDDPIPFVAVPRGKGGRLAAIPLVEEGVQAARDFVALGAFGSWSCPSANKALARAARHAQRPAFTVYAIRHSFAAGLRRTGTDVADIQDLYGHTNPRDDGDLCAATTGQAPSCDRASARAGEWYDAETAGSTGWQYLDGRCKLLILNARP